MNVLLVANDNKDVNLLISKEIIGYLKEKNVTIYCDEQLMVDNFDLVKLTDNYVEKIDFALIVGGDGTVLKYASRYGKCSFPFVGVNLGRVGALTIIGTDKYKEYIDRILNKDYFVVERLGLECSISFHEKEDGISFVGYNDIILHRSLSLKLLPIVIGINDSSKDLFYADGIVIATPSGSSAYNVSAGGPLLSHSSKSYVVTPICPQSKSFTSLVVGEEDEVCLNLSNKSDIRDNEVTISADGCYAHFVSPLDEIRIKKAESGLKMIQFNEVVSAYETVHKAVVSIEKKGERNNV